MAYKPYKVKKEKDIKKYGESNVKVFGFRSGLSYKMIPAMFYYIFAALYIFSGIYGEIKYYAFEPEDIVLMISKYIFFIIMFYSPLIFLSDFSYRDSLPFFKKREIGSTLIGLILVWMFCYFMVNINIYCMSDTYKKAQADYEIKLQQERIIKEKANQETTVLETTIPIETTDKK